MLTEQEAHDCLRTNLRSAIQHCIDLANVPLQGVVYLEMIGELEAIEGAARQVGAFRSDMRWNLFGWEMAQFRQRIGDALRSHASRKIFLHMAGMMKGALDETDKLRVAKTGRRGPILPKAKEGPHRETRPVYVKRPSGLILPAAA